MESTIQYVRLARAGIGQPQVLPRGFEDFVGAFAAKLMSRPLVTESGQLVACSKLWLTMVWWL